MANGLSLVIIINGGQWICPFNFHHFGQYYFELLPATALQLCIKRQIPLPDLRVSQACWHCRAVDFFVVYLEKVHRPGNKAVLVHCIELPEFTKARTYILLWGYILACFKRTTINIDFTIGPWVLQITNRKSWVTIRASSCDLEWPWKDRMRGGQSFLAISIITLVLFDLEWPNLSDREKHVSLGSATASSQWVRSLDPQTFWTCYIYAHVGETMWWWS